MADITITEGDTLEVDYNLENTGDGTGTFDPRLLIQGVQEDQDTGITLDPAQTATGTLQWPTESGDAVTDALAEAVTDDTSDSITVTVEDTIPDSVVDHFETSLYEDQSKSLSDYYSGDLSSYTRQQNTVYEQTYAMEGGATGFITSTDGLNYPSPGDTFSAWLYNSGSSNNDSRFGLLYGCPTAGELTGYEARLGRPNDDTQLNLYRWDNGSQTTIDNVDLGGYPTSEWLELEVAWGTGGGHSLTLYDSSGSSLGSLSNSDGTYTSQGIGWNIVTFGATVYFDNYRIK